MKLDIAIRGMHCAGCVKTIEDAARSTPGITQASVNFASERATLEVEPIFDPAGFRDRLVGLGYRLGTERRAWRIRGLDAAAAPLESRIRALPGVFSAEVSAGTLTLEVLTPLFTPESLAPLGLDLEPMTLEAGPDPDQRAVAWRTIIAVPAAATVMILAMTGMSHGSHGSAVYLQAGLAALVQFGGGWPYHAGFLRALRHGSADMSTLVSIGTNVAFGYSVYAMARGVDMVYFETSAMIIAVVLVGRWLELKSRQGTREAVRALAALVPGRATRLLEGREEQVPVEQLVIKDLIRVRPGERVAADGVVETGSTSIDESLLTGESLPVAKKPGDVVLGGSVNAEGSVDVRVSATGEQTMVAQIRRIVVEAQGSKSSIQRLADRIAGRFVPAVLLAAVATFVAWWLIGDSTAALRCTVAVLVVACPCAMGLATPTAVMVAVGRGAALGILIKSAETLESLARVRRVVFDKTGTLTIGRPRVWKSDPEALRIAAAVEIYSEHPLARAIVAACPERPAAENFQARPGYGAIGRVEGREVAIGNRAFMEILDVTVPAPTGEPGTTEVLVSCEGEFVGTIHLADEIRDDARPAVELLTARGMEVWLISGDEQKTAQDIAARAGILKVRGRVLPTDKAEAIRELQKDGGAVAMVGDGINDGPALAAADVGIAIGGGSDVAVETADVVLLRGGLRRVATAVQLGRESRRVILQNFGWAAGYNFLLIPVAAGLLKPIGVVLDPIWAATAMALSSVSVVLNSLRLRRFS